MLHRASGVEHGDEGHWDRPGTVCERTPGHWELRAFGGDDSVTGKQILRSKTFVGSELAAAKALGTCVRDFESRNRRKIDHRIRPLLGDLKLEKLDTAGLDKTYRYWLDQGLSEATVHKYHWIPSAARRRAVKWDYLDRAPTDKASSPRRSPSRYSFADDGSWSP